MANKRNIEMLASYRAQLATIRSGGTVENLTEAGALASIAGLEACVAPVSANKRTMRLIAICLGIRQYRADTGNAEFGSRCIGEIISELNGHGDQLERLGLRFNLRSGVAQSVIKRYALRA